jgi:hypothetical protein
MQPSIRFTQKCGNTEQSIEISVPSLIPDQLNLEVSGFVPGDLLSALPSNRVGSTKLDSRFKPLPLDATGPAWCYTRDDATGLIWTRGVVLPQAAPWAKCKEAIDALGHGFRAPTLREQLTNIDYDRFDPAYDPAYFDGPTSGWLWTSTDYAPSKDAAGVASAARCVHLHHGHVSTIHRVYNRAFVRAVRSGVPAGQ